MKYQDFKKIFGPKLVFSLAQVLVADPGFHRQQLSRWAKVDKVIGLARGFYTFPGLDLNESVLAFVANQIYKPSYVSLEFAFSLYNFIPEGVYLITSISTKKTTQMSTPLATFNYRSVKPELMFGYELQKFEYQGQIYRFNLATAEKSILDYLYLNPKIQAPEDFAGLRWQREEMRAKLDPEKLENFLAVYQNNLLEKRVQAFLEYLE